MPFGRFKRDRARQRGNLVVTSFILVMAMMLVVGGIQGMLKEQIRQGTEIQRVAFGRLQALYLAEMGVNHLMHIANKAANAAVADPFPVTAGAPYTYDFKPHVAMVRDDAAGAAVCVINRVSGTTFEVTATLQTEGGPFNRTVRFGAQKVNNSWVLASFQVMP